MAGADRMAVEEVVRNMLVDEHADVLRARDVAIDHVRGRRALAG